VRTLAILVLIASTRLASSWPGGAYTEVRGYAYNPEVGESIWHDGKLASSVINKSGALLTTAQTQLLLRAITKKPPKSIDYTNCFSPHHAFVFYDAHQKAVAWVEVCFHCNNIKAEPSAPGERWPDMQALLTLSKHLKLPNTPQRQADLTNR
jgi:hypothetical protein